MCGIFGIINKEKSKFNKTLFNVLGIHNDTRGGDSCGIFIDRKEEYGVGKHKYYENFFPESKVLKDTKNCHIALGHCRKASVGGVDPSKAHPIIIYDDDGNPEFCVIHNGTINNYEELAKKYIPEINIKNMSDSQVMTQIFYHSGYDVLGDYNGGAVFVIVDYRQKEDKPLVYFWKGRSTEYSYSKVKLDERPFFFIHTEKEIVFSSLSTFLKAAYPGETIYTVHANTLAEVKNNVIYNIREFDRSNNYQSKYSYASKTTTSTSTGSYYTKSITLNEIEEFRLGGKNLHGKKWCTPYGFGYDEEDETINNKWCYFYEGVLLYNKDCFDMLTHIQSKFNYESSEKFAHDYPEIVCYFSAFPIKVAKDSPYYTITNDFCWKPFTGSFYYVMAKYTQITCDDGKLKSTAYTAPLTGWNEFGKLSAMYKLDKESIKSNIKSVFHVDI